MKNKVQFLALVCLFAFNVIVIFGCDFESTGENAEQTRRSFVLQNALLNVQKNGDILFPKKIAWLPTYSNSCRYANPRIAFEDCLQFLIEGENMDSARRNAIHVAETIQTVISTQADFQLTGIYVVLIPVLRHEGYLGHITPASMKHFETGDPLVIKMGE
ncbi:hypothetical protein [Noviherbaspirillum cavernae]|nr:hypothetical protein [Noviherbaspirillum cavernae]